jgi:hypothetical protein
MELWLNEQRIEHELSKTSTIDDCYARFVAYCDEATRLFVPSKPVRLRKREWISRDTIKSLRKKNKLYSRWRLSTSEEDRSAFERARTKCRKMLSADKQAWIRSTFDAHSPTSFWTGVRRLLKPPRRSLPTLSDGANSATTDEEKAAMLQNQYEQVWTTSSGDIDLEQGPAERIVCTPHWTRRRLRKLSTTKAVGPDGVHPVMLKKMANALGARVALVITRSVQDGRVPQVWKAANVVPVPKVVGSVNACDYRPISITSAVSKLAERFVLEQIQPAIEARMPSTQYGFRPGRSTIDALVDAEYHAMKEMDRCRGASRVALVSFDIRKAFDSISHARLMLHLRSTFDLPLYARRWIYALTVGRQQRVRVGAAHSAWSDVRSGTGQGTVLSPLLYSAATAGIQHVKLSAGSRMVLFADDLLLVKGLESADDEQTLQADCSAIEEYYNRELLTINASKTSLLLASLSPGGAKPLLKPLLVGGSAIEQVDKLKYLGAIFDKRLTFTHHARSAAAKTRQMLAVVGNTLKRWHMRAEIAHIYTMCIRPALTYAIAVTHARTDEGRQAVERVNRAAARMVLNSYSASYKDMLCKLRWPSIASLASREQLRLAHVYVNNISGDGETEGTNAPIWSAIRYQNARRSARHSNGRDLRIVGPPPRRAHAHNTALNTLISRWNALPASVVQQPTRTMYMLECEKLISSNHSFIHY